MDKYPNTKLDSDIEVTVIKKDGNKKSYNTNYFEKLDIGDKLILNIRMPEKKPFINSSLCMKLYNCTVDIKYNDRLLYSYGHDQVKNNKQIGNVFVNIGLPDDAWGNDITVECYNYENDSLDKVRNVLLFPTEMSLRYPIAGNKLEFVFCMASVGLAIFVLVMVLLFGTFNKIERQGFYLGVFVATMGIWMLGFNDMLYMIISETHIAANAEYVALFFMPVPFCGFLMLGSEGKSRYIDKILLNIYSIFFIVATFLNFTTTIHYTKLVHVMRGLLAAGLIIVILVRIFVKQEINLNLDIIWMGIIISGAILLLDVLRFEISGVSPEFAKMFPYSFSVLGMFTFVFSLSGGYFAAITSEMHHKKHLEEVAYLDGMTGVYNRTGAKKIFNKIDIKQDYSMVFFDVNNLKVANDEYGHETIKNSNRG